MKQKYFPTENELAIIRDNYDGSTIRIGKIMRLLGRKYPRWYVRRMAGKMGLSRVKEPYWTREEENYLQENYPKMGFKALRRGLINNGMFPRSISGIKLKLKRLGMASSYDDGFTLRGLERLFWGGQEQHHIIMRWINKGWLRGKRRGTLRERSQGGDMWYFSPDRVRSFIVKHPEEIDLRLVDPIAFIQILAGNAETYVLCRCPDCGREWDKKVYAPGVNLLRIRCDTCRISVANVEDDGEYRIAL